MGTLELGIALFIAFLGFKKYHMTKALPILFLTFLVLVLLVFSGKMGQTGFNAPIKHALKFVHILFAFVCCLYFQYGATIKSKRYFVIAVLVAAAASCLRSIYLVMIGNDYMIRYASRYGYSAEGVAGFGQIYGIPFLTVIVCSVLFNGKKKKLYQNILLVGLLGIFLYFIGVSLLTTALVLTVIGILLFTIVKLVRKNKSVALIMLVSVILIIAVLILVFPNQIMDLVNSLTSNMNYILKNRLRYIAEKVLQVSSNITYTHERREELAGYSLHTFSEHPLFGVGYFGYGYGVIGCHQEWADMLGVFGAIGSLAVFAVLGIMLRTAYRYLRSREEKDLFLILVAMFIILGFLNPCLGAPLLIAVFAVAPNIKYLYSFE